MAADLALSSILATGMLLASWASAGLLAFYMSVVSVLVTLVAARRLSGPAPAGGPVASALSAGAFPFWLWAEGESGLLWGAASVVLCVACALLVSRPSGRALNLAATLMCLPLLIGYGLSYSVLIRQDGRGARLLLCVSLILLAYRGSAVILDRTGIGDRVGGKRAGNLPARLGGVAAAEVAAIVSLLFLGEPFSAGPLAVLGVLVALAAMLGEASSRWMFSQDSETRFKAPLPAGVEAWLIALPAFFYGFRLYLT